MRWHIARNGQVIETAEEATIREWAKRGQLTPDLYLQAESGGPWIPVAHSPFGTPAPKQRNGAAMLLFGVAAVLMSCGFLAWVGDKVGPKEGAALAVASVTAPVSATPTPKASAPETVVSAATSAPAPGIPDRPHLQVNKSSLKATFEKFEIPFKSVPLLDGTPRLLGTHPDKLSTFEIVGYGDRVESTSLTMGLANDRPLALIRNTGMMMVFMRETGWEKGGDWVTDRLKKGGGKIIKNGVEYEVIDIGGTGLFCLSAEPAPIKSTAKR